MSEPLKKATLLLGSLVFSAVILIGAYEAVSTLRYQRWRESFTGTAWLGTVTVPSENPILMWEYRPNAEHKRIRTNRFGFRDRADVQKRKPPGEFRVAFVGDSVTLGYGEEEEEIFVRRFEQAINRDLSENPHVEALNFGIDGYSAPQIAELLRRRVIDFSPDWVVYALCLNDFDFETSAGDKVRYFHKPRSFFLVKLEHVIRKLRGIDFHTHKFRKNRRQVFEDILDMREVLKKHESNFLLAVLPIFPVEVNSFARYSHQGIHDSIHDFATSNGIAMIDVLTSFRNGGGPPRAYANDIWHPNAEGHRLIGEAIAAGLAPKLAKAQLANGPTR